MLRAHLVRRTAARALVLLGADDGEGRVRHLDARVAQRLGPAAPASLWECVFGANRRSGRLPMAYALSLIGIANSIILHIQL